VRRPLDKLINEADAFPTLNGYPVSILAKNDAQQSLSNPTSIARGWSANIFVNLVFWRNI
jgi:hypothetical protein